MPTVSRRRRTRRPACPDRSIHRPRGPGCRPRCRRPAERRTGRAPAPTPPRSSSRVLNMLRSSPSSRDAAAPASSQRADSFPSGHSGTEADRSVAVRSACRVSPPSEVRLRVMRCSASTSIHFQCEPMFSSRSPGCSAPSDMRPNASVSSPLIASPPGTAVVGRPHAGHEQDPVRDRRIVEPDGAAGDVGGGGRGADVRHLLQALRRRDHPRRGHEALAGLPRQLVEHVHARHGGRCRGNPPARCCARPHSRSAVRRSCRRAAARRGCWSIRRRAGSRGRRGRVTGRLSSRARTRRHAPRDRRARPEARRAASRRRRPRRRPQRTRPRGRA